MNRITSVALLCAGCIFAHDHSYAVPKPHPQAVSHSGRHPHVGLSQLNTAQRDAVNDLLLRTNGTLEIALEEDATAVGVLGGFNFDTQTTDPAKAFDVIALEYFPEIATAYALTLDDMLTSRIITNRAGDFIWGYTIALERYHKGYRVDDDLMHVHLVAHNTSESTQTLLFTSVSAHIRPINPNANIKPEWTLTANESIFIAEVALGSAITAESSELVVLAGAQATLAYRIEAQLEGDAHLLYIDAYSGEILYNKRQVAHRTGTIFAGATNPNEPYTTATGKTPKPLPCANLYRGVSGSPIRGASTKFVGATNYNGFYDSPTQASDGSICTDCWAFDPRSQSRGCSDINDTSPGVSDYTQELVDILTSPDGANHIIPWVGQISRRTEGFYHLSYAKHFVADFFGQPVRKTNFKMHFDSDCNACGALSPDPALNPCTSMCSAGSASCTSSLCDVNIFCGKNADDTNKLYNDGEVMTRNAIYHEYTHVVDHASRGYHIDVPSWLCPNRPECFSEQFAIFGAGMLSAFESQHPARDVRADSTFPADYSCEDAYLGVPFTTIFNDYALFAGPLAFQSILWHLPLLNNSTRLIGCANECCFENCSSNSYYRHLVTKSRDPWNQHWQTAFEVSRAFHNRITDSDPQISCNGGVLSINDPHIDSFPYADDMTNVSYLAPFFFMNNPPNDSMISTATTFWGAAEFGPSTCEYSSPSSCKPLALDHVGDLDKWGLVAREGEEYEIRTETGHAGVDTILEILDATGSSVVNECGSTGSQACHNDDCATCASGNLCSCLKFRPNASGVYRIHVFPYHSSTWNSDIGSLATYNLQVLQQDDDHGDTFSAATPVPPDGKFRTAFINSDSPADHDWFYVIQPSAGDIRYSLCSRDGDFEPMVAIYDQYLNFVGAYSSDDCGSWQTATLAKGLYYFRIDSPSSTIGAYRYAFKSSIDIGSTVSTAFDLYDPAIIYPNSVRSVASELSGASDKDVFRFWAHQGEFINLDVEANPNSGWAALRLLTMEGAFDVEIDVAECNRDNFEVYWESPTYILQDKQGGVARSPDELQRNSQMALTAPRTGYYYVEVFTDQNVFSSGYVLQFYPTGVAITDYPPMP